MIEKYGQVKEETAAGVEQDALEAPSLLGSVSDATLEGHIRDAWERNRRHKLDIQKRLLYCLRARKGEYSPDQLAQLMSQGGSNPIYVKLTGTKSRAASAWIRDTLMPSSGERPFAVEPTSIAELPTFVDNAVRERAKKEATQMIVAGEMDADISAALEFIDKVRDKSIEALNGKAKEKARRMERRISDLMDEGGWEEAFEEFIEDFVTYPTAYIKGPYVRKVRTLKWGKGFTPEPVDETVLSWRRVSPFDMYPSPFAKNLQESELIERLRYMPHQLEELIDVEGYDKEKIKQVLMEYDSGGLREWIWEDFEKEQLESSSSFLTADDNTLDVLHYWGKVQGKLLKQWGYSTTNLEDHKYYEVDAMLIGTTVIRAVLNQDPLGTRPYHYACWDSVPGSMWGVALPEQMADHQAMVNGCARAVANNLALSSGPQVGILTDMLAEGESIGTMHPFKIWQLKSSLTGNSGKPIEFFQPESNVTEYMGTMEKWITMSDDVTNVPRYSYGNERIGGAGATATGLSMLMNSAAKGIRRAISNIDANIIRPTVRQAFVHLMLHDPDNTIKGDCKIVARGAAALLIKEQNLTRLQAFLAQTVNPMDASIISMRRRALALREVARIMNLPPEIIPSDDELKAIEMQQQQAAQAQLGPQGTPPNPETAGGDQSIEQANGFMKQGVG